LVVGLFILFKHFRADWLTDHSPEFWRVFLYSFPNFCEGVIGVFILTGIGIYFRAKLYHSISYKVLYFIAAGMALIYTITQEVKLHHLGGKNIYDPYDVLFSILGVGVGLLIVMRMQPLVKPSNL